ncbi:MAG: hypothetical protein K0Q50_224 [Vampirovibrio sp.]|jgi:hypothetical protein|nr:hypothetical protein [Vampirovibrio sp.]
MRSGFIRLLKRIIVWGSKHTKCCREVNYWKERAGEHWLQYQDLGAYCDEMHDKFTEYGVGRDDMALEDRLELALQEIKTLRGEK